ncbi:MAG: esterase family protein [Saprospiraceae bacterium]|nr:esterase family protein [Saprospiraceae bacterium]
MNAGIMPRQVQHDYSRFLHRHVTFDVYLPPDYAAAGSSPYPLLLFNDGQDLPATGLGRTLETLMLAQKIRPAVVVGVYAGAQRKHEYGTARQADYKQRGDKAPQYRDFILLELLPHLREKWHLSVYPTDNVFAGFSLGGLSALDIAWAHPEVFGAAGVFSGSLWWRWADVDPADPDRDRIMHDIVRHSPEPRPNAQRFWFQAGTLDETEDRNHNGVIDAIDDTLHLIEALRQRGYPEAQLRYLQLEGGTHDPATWGKAMPDFLQFVL